MDTDMIHIDIKEEKIAEPEVPEVDYLLSYIYIHNL